MTNRYGYNGGNEYEDEGELNYSNTFYRKYDAQIGRFTGVDMLAENFVSLNPYNYGNNNPVMFNDPTGALNQLEFNHIINTLWNSPFGGTWSSEGGGTGGGFGGGSNIYLFGNNETANFFGSLGVSGNNYGFGTDGNLRVNGLFVTSFKNRQNGVSFGGYYEGAGGAQNGNTLSGVVMGSVYFRYLQAYNGPSMQSYDPSATNWAGKWERCNEMMGEMKGGGAFSLVSKAAYGIASTFWYMGSQLRNGTRNARNMKGENIISTYGSKAAERIRFGYAMTLVTLPTIAIGGEGAVIAAEEETVYRVFGGDSRAEGYSWTSVNPSSVSNFRNVAGLPSGGESGFNNTAQFMIEGRVNVRNIIESRSALPLDGNIGGHPEYLINPKNISITNFTILHP